MGAYEYVDKWIEQSEIKNRSQIDVKKLKQIYNTIDKETQKKDTTRITSKSSPDAIINAVSCGYGLTLDYKSQHMNSVRKKLRKNINLNRKRLTRIRTNINKNNESIVSLKNDNNEKLLKDHLSEVNNSVNLVNVLNNERSFEKSQQSPIQNQSKFIS